MPTQTRTDGGVDNVGSAQAEQPLERVLAALAARGCKPKPSGGGYAAKCPAHEDDSPSLTFAVGDKGVVLKCQAGCDTKDVVRALGLDLRDLFPPKAPVERPKAKKADLGQLVATYAYRDEKRELLFEVLRYEKIEAGKRTKTFRQRKPGKAPGEWVWSLDRNEPVRRVPYCLPELVEAIAAGRTVFVCEGEKAVETARKLGVDATCNSGGASHWLPSHTECLKGARVVVLPDNDPPGAAHADQVARSLHGIAASVRVLALPNLPPKGDRLDGVAGAGPRPRLEQLAATAPEWVPQTSPSGARRPDIEISEEEEEIVEQVVRAFQDDPEVFQRDGKLVDVIANANPLDGVMRQLGAPRIRLLPPARLRGLITDRVCLWKWVRTKSGDEIRVRSHPPDWLVKQVDSRGDWPGIRYLNGVSECPVLRPDGSILTEPGYDAATGLLYAPKSAPPPIPTHPTIDDARAACIELLDVVCDFPFESKAHLSAWLASLLTVVGRYAFPGPAPLFLIDANARGAGKSMLADVVSAITTGRRMSRQPYPDNEEEMRKQVTTIALEGKPMVLLDNINSALGGSSLDAALTGVGWSDRVLGKSESTGDVLLFTVWFASGNNVRLRGDMSRRICHVRMNTPHENPEVREDFKHPQLVEWVLQERQRLLAAALTILRAFILAGRPQRKLRAWGSFEGWSALVRQAVCWLDMADPGDTRTELEQQGDAEKAGLGRVIEAWFAADPNGYGLSVNEVAKEQQTSEGRARFGALWQALVDFSPGKGGATPTTKSIGMKIHHHRNRVVGGKFLFRKGENANGAVWAVRMAEGQGNGTSSTNETSSGPYAGAHPGARTRAGDGTPEGTEPSPPCPSSPEGQGFEETL